MLYKPMQTLSEVIERADLSLRIASRTERLALNSMLLVVVLLQIAGVIQLLMAIIETHFPPAGAPSQQIAGFVVGAAHQVLLFSVVSGLAPTIILACVWLVAGWIIQRRGRA